VTKNRILFRHAGHGQETPAERLDLVVFRGNRTGSGQHIELSRQRPFDTDDGTVVREQKLTEGTPLCAGAAELAKAVVPRLP
jgi:hypothetical protein